MSAAARFTAGCTLALLATALLAGRLGEGDLVGDPVIYAALAKAMLLRGDWGTQYLAGQPFFDKPPLVVWLTRLSFELFGMSTWSARLPAVVLGIVACLVLWRLGALLFDEQVGLAAGAILALTPGFVRFGSTLLYDTALVLGGVAGLLATARAFARGGRGLWWAGVWFGLGFLGKGALALGAPAVLAAYWLATPSARRPPFTAVLGAGIAFLAVVLPWHLYEIWRWGGRFVHGYLADVSEKMGEPPGIAVYVRALVITTLPWLPLALFGAWRVWRSAERPEGLRLLVVWTLVAYGFLFVASKHSPRYLMLLHPALALWAALALRPVLPAPRALSLWVAGAAGLAWAVMLVWPHPLHPGGTGAAVRALDPVLGSPDAPLNGFRLRHEGTRARFAYYTEHQDVRTFEDPDALVRLGAGTPVVTAVRDAGALAADGRFEELRRSRDYVAFRVR